MTFWLGLAFTAAAIGAVGYGLWRFYIFSQGG